MHGIIAYDLGGEWWSGRRELEDGVHTQMLYRLQPALQYNRVLLLVDVRPQYT